MQKVKKILTSLLTCIALSTAQSQADSYYLTNSRPIISSSRFINDIKVSDQVVAWQELRTLTNILKAYHLESKVISSLATSQISFASLQVLNSQVAWLDTRKPGGYFTWNISEGTKKITTPETNLKKLLLLSEGVLYESAGDSVNTDHITLRRDDGSMTFFNEKNLIGYNRGSFVIDTSLLENAAAATTINLDSQQRQPFYKSSASGSYIVGGSFLNYMNSTAWIVGERLPAQNTIEYILTYHDGVSGIPIARIPITQMQTDLSDTGVFWNQFNAAKSRHDLYTWSPTKGRSFLNEKLPAAYRFAVNSTNVFISNTNTLYQTDIIEYPALPPNVAWNRSKTNPQTLEFKVRNPVQGKIYTFQYAQDLQGPWQDLDRIPTNLQLNSQNAADAVQFQHSFQNSEPTGFLRVKVDTP
ncbi:MAG: hypothetical protein AABY00_03140 [Nanoarchaeota archaeon]